MWIANNIAARALTWFVALTFLVQGLPVSSCECSSNQSCSQKGEQSTGCCCRIRLQTSGKTVLCCCSQGQPLSCCATQNSKASSDSICDSRLLSGAECPCGTNCHCGSNQTPAEPATPMEEENKPTEQVVDDCFSAPSVAPNLQPQSSHRSQASEIQQDVPTALDRCISLCRFRL